MRFSPRAQATTPRTPLTPYPAPCSTEEYTQAKTHFDAADADRSGSVTVAEMQRYLSAGCQRPVPLHYARMIVRCFDTSGDGALDFAEFFTLHSMIQQCVFLRAAPCLLARGKPASLTPSPLHFLAASTAGLAQCASPSALPRPTGA